jgi:hypothetical protein
MMTEQMKEQWTRWEPVQGLAAKYYIDAIYDTIDEGLKIVLSDINDRKKKVRVIFEKGIDAYRSTDESYRLGTIDDLDIEYGTEFYAYWTFFKVTNSSYVKWLSEESYGCWDSLPWIHFSFVALDSIIDVVTVYEPRVEFIESST